jgi:hypothetical protein
MTTPEAAKVELEGKTRPSSESLFSASQSVPLAERLTKAWLL